MSEAPGCSEGGPPLRRTPEERVLTRRLKSWIQLNVIAAAGEFLISFRARIPGLA